MKNWSEAMWNKKKWKEKSLQNGTHRTKHEIYGSAKKWETEAQTSNNNKKKQKRM